MSRASEYATAVSNLYAKIGEARATEAANKGAIWSGALANIGDFVAQYPERQARMKEIENRAEETKLRRERLDMEVADKQRAQEKQQAVAALAQKHGGINDAFVSELSTLFPEDAPEIGKTWNDFQNSALTRRERILKNQQAELDELADLVGPVTDQLTYTQQKLKGHVMGLDVSRLPDNYEQAKPQIEALRRGTESGRKQLEQQLKEIAEQRQAAAAKAEAANKEADNARMDAAAKAQAAEQAIDNARADAQLRVSQGQLGVAQGNLAVRQKEAAASDATSTETGIPKEYGLLLNRATLSIPAVRRPAIVQTARMAFEQGGEAALKDVIRQAAVDTENVDTRNQVLGRVATMASLKDAQDILEEMAKAGVPTNILAGTAEDVARKLGTSTNPKYVELGNRLAGTLINYRRAATGVQFGEREGAEYAKMFPNYKNTLPVNKALIAGLVREMATYDKAYWTHKLGPEGAALVGVVPSTAKTTTSGVDVKAPDGNTYHFNTQGQADAFKRRVGIK